MSKESLKPVGSSFHSAKTKKNKKNPSLRFIVLLRSRNHEISDTSYTSDVGVQSLSRSCTRCRNTKREKRDAQDDVWKRTWRETWMRCVRTHAKQFERGREDRKGGCRPYNAGWWRKKGWATITGSPPTRSVRFPPAHPIAARLPGFSRSTDGGKQMRTDDGRVAVKTDVNLYEPPHPSMPFTLFTPTLGF